MLIRSSSLFRPSVLQRPTHPVGDQAKKVPGSSFKETALRNTIVGASLGTVAGESIGRGAILAAGGFGGWRLGEHMGGGLLSSAVGAVLGTTAAFLVEKKLPLGATLGAVGGFLSGGLIGGVAGSVIGGVQAVANSNLFEKR